MSNSVFIFTCKCSRSFLLNIWSYIPLLANSANNINWPSKNFVWNFVGVTNFVLVSLQNLSPFEKPMPNWGSFSIFWVGHNINISARAGLVQDCQDPVVGFTFISNQTVQGQDWVQVLFWYHWLGKLSITPKSFDDEWAIFELIYS